MVILALGFLALGSDRVITARRVGENKPAVLGEDIGKITVTDEKTNDFSDQILGQALPFDSIELLRNSEYVELVKNLAPKLIRGIHYRKYYEETSNKNWWWRGNMSSISTIESGKLVLDAGGDTTKSGYAMQRIWPENFEEGAKYELRYNYKATGVQLVNQSEAWKLAIDGVMQRYVEQDVWWSAGKNQLTLAKRFKMPTGDSQGEAVSTFTYYSGKGPGKAPSFVDVSFTMAAGVLGRVEIDNVSLVKKGNDVNLLKDGGFSETVFPTDDRYLYRVTTAEVDEIFDFLRKVGNPGLIWEMMGFATVKPNLQMDWSTPPENLEKVIWENQLPEIEAAFEGDLKILRYMKSKGYRVDYFEPMNEYEITWAWINDKNATGDRLGDLYNFGMEEVKTKVMYRLYGKLFSLASQKIKEIYPEAKVIAAVNYGDKYLGSLQGFMDGLEQYRVAKGLAIPVWPDAWAPHPYQLKPWGNSPRCPDGGVAERKLCIDSLFTRNNLQCNMSNFRIPGSTDNWESMDFYEAYFDCVKGFLQSRGVVKPVFVNTEWGLNGSSSNHYGTFGEEIWNMDRLGKLAEQEVAGSIHWNLSIVNGLLTDLGGINSPYLTYTLLGKMLGGGGVEVMRAVGPDKNRVSVYAFKKPDGGQVILTVNFSNQNLQLGLDSGNGGARKRILLTCEGTDCLYDRKQTDETGEIYMATRVNGRKVNSQNVGQILSGLEWESLSSGSDPINFPAYSASIIYVGNGYPGVGIVPTPMSPTPTPVNVLCRGASVSSTTVGTGETVTFNGGVSTAGWTKRLRYVYGEAPGNGEVGATAVDNFVLRADVTKGRKIWFWTNLAKTFEGKEQICRGWDSRWDPAIPASWNQSSSCQNSCVVSMEVKEKISCLGSRAVVGGVVGRVSNPVGSAMMVNYEAGSIPPGWGNGMRYSYGNSPAVGERYQCGYNTPSCQVEVDLTRGNILWIWTNVFKDVGGTRYYCRGVDSRWQTDKPEFVEGGPGGEICDNRSLVRLDLGGGGSESGMGADTVGDGGDGGGEVGSDSGAEAPLEMEEGGPLTGSVVAGDADGDRVVNLLDLQVWKTEYLGGPGLMADFNGDGKVDLLDLGEWKTGYLN